MERSNQAGLAAMRGDQRLQCRLVDSSALLEYLAENGCVSGLRRWNRDGFRSNRPGVVAPAAFTVSLQESEVDQQGQLIPDNARIEGEGESYLGCGGSPVTLDMIEDPHLNVLQLQNRSFDFQLGRQ